MANLQILMFGYNTEYRPGEWFQVWEKRQYERQYARHVNICTGATLGESSEYEVLSNHTTECCSRRSSHGESK